MSVYRVTKENFNAHDTWDNDWYNCPNCAFDSLDISFKHCPICGENLVFYLDAEGDEEEEG